MEQKILRREQLHDYQKYCVDFVESHPEALLILEMGLGKTAISLTAIYDLMLDSFEVGKTLVIAPLRVATSVWPVEKDKWRHTKALRMSVMTGSAKDRIAALHNDADVYVINRENVKWLVDYLEKMHKPWPFDFVVIDELSSFKNHKSQRWRALKKVRPQISRIVGLTGTPVPNGLMDLWAEVGLIDMGKRLGRFIGRYREAYFRPSGMNPYTGVVYSYDPLPGAEEQIYKKISDISISMRSLEYLDMPECISVTHEVEMTKAERAVYEKMKRDLVVKLGDKTVDAANAAVLSGKLLQMANGALYTDDEGSRALIHNHKLEALEDLIEQANGQSVLVAYWFKHDRERIMDYLTEKGYAPRDMKTNQDICDWNDGKIQVALVSPASAGHGLNIQHGGHILIWFSLCWSLELYEQTNARLWRQGQESVVTIHHLVCKGTVDEDVLRALKEKSTTQQGLISAVKAHLK